MPQPNSSQNKHFIQINQAIFSLRNVYESRLRHDTRQDPQTISVGEYGVLMVIGQIGRLTSRELADRMDITPATVSQFVRRLRNRGLIEQIRDTADRRIWWLVLSESGQEAYGNAVEGTIRYTEDLLSVLSPEDRQEFHRLLLAVAKGNGYGWI